jgi:hypothetical protein
MVERQVSQPVILATTAVIGPAQVRARILFTVIYESATAMMTILRGTIVQDTGCSRRLRTSRKASLRSVRP